MKKKTIILLMISIVIIMSVSAISAADANDTLQEQVSDTDIETISSNLEAEDTAASTLSEVGTDVEKISASEAQIEKSNQKADNASSKLNDDVLSASSDDVLKADKENNLNNDVLAASSDDLLGDNPNFYYNGQSYEDLDDAVSAACDNNGGTIQITARTWGYDSAEREITISKGVSITFEPIDADAEVIFDGNDYSGNVNNRWWFFKIDDKNARVTFKRITFRNGGDGSLACDGGAIRIVHGQVTMTDCIFDNNKASENKLGGYGLGGAIYLDESDASLIAKNCSFTNNKASNGGGAVFVEDGAAASFEGCYFEGNTADGSINHVQTDEGDGSSYSFTDCLFKGDGSITIEENPLQRQVEISPVVNDDDVDHIILYKDGAEYARKSYDGADVTFGDLETLLEPGTYTVYMAKGDAYSTEKRYDYNKQFKIVEPNFVLTIGENTTVFDNLRQAISAIPNRGSGEIYVAGGTWNGTDNLGLYVSNKIITIMPKPEIMPKPVDASDDEPVVFLGLEESYFLSLDYGQLIMNNINITGNFTDGALILNYCTECYISECAFDNICHLATSVTPYPNPGVTYYVDSPGVPIYTYCTTLVLDECTFDSNRQSLFRNSTVNITDCEYTNNSGYMGGAINADSTSNLTITDSEFSLNEATIMGGAIFATNLKINYTEFIGNIAPIGGAIYITNQSDSEVNISGCVFDSNFAKTYRNIYTESATREITLIFNEYDLNLAILEKDGVYGVDYIMETVFDWGVNLNNNDTLILGTLDDETPFLELVDIEGDKFTLNLGVLSGGPHEIILDGMYTQEDSLDHFVGHGYYTDLNGNEFYLDINKWASLQFNIEKAKIALNLTVENVLIPKIPVLNLYANFDENFTIFLGTTVYHVQVVNGKGSLELTGLDLGNYTVVAMRSSDENFELALNFTTFSVSKTYSNFLVLSTNVEYKTLKEAIVNSNDDDTIYIKKGTYNDTGIVISNKTLDIIALEGAVFDAQGHDANFIIVTDTAEATIYGITFRGIHNRNTNYGAIVNHGYLTVNSCNFTDNTITKTSFAENGGAAIFSDGDSLEIDNCNFINNVAPLKASTAAVTSLGYEDVSITSSRFINNTAREGGALHFKNLIQFESAVASCDFEQNTAVKGSTIYIGNNSRYVSVTLSGFSKNDIKNNKGENAELEGGVIYVNANDAEVTLDISLSHFESNSNKDVDGGVICLDGTSNANIDTCIFKDNKGKVGSVILVKNPNNEKLRLFIESSVLANNSATRGAIATSPKVTAFLDECVFADNTGEYRNIYSNGFTVAHDSIFDVKNAELNAMNVKYGESSLISGKADTGTNLYSAANLTVAGENVTVEIKDNTFTYTTDILNSGKHHAVLNGIVDYNNNTYVMDSITKIFRVNKATIDLNVSVDNIIYGETLKVTETLPANVNGTIGYYLNGVYYTKEELESLKLDVGKHTLVAYYNHEDYEPAYSLVDFDVYKAKANISVADVEVGPDESIILNIETNAPSIYTIEIGKYKLITLINGSKSIEVDETFAPGTYTIRVTSKERVNYMSTSTEAVLKVKDESLLVTSNNAPEQPIVTSISTSQSPIDNSVLNTLGANNFKLNSQDDLLIATNNDLLSDDESIFDDYEETGNFIYQEDEDDDPQYFDTLEEAIDEASLMGGIITVRGGTYNGWGFCGIDIEGELEITIRAYPGEEVIFDCEGEDYFLHLTYDTEVEVIETVPPIPIVYTTEGPTITLENITVINGYNSEGGAIELVAGTLTMINCNFYNNFAEDYGGAICIGSMNSDQDATVIALNCTFMNNIAGEEGGAIYIEADWEQESTASFAFCTFLDNFQGEEGSRTRNYFAGPEVNEITRQYCLFDGTGEIYSVDIDKIEQIVTVNGTSPDPFDSVVLLYNNTLPLYTVYNNGSQNFYITFEDVIGGNYTLGVMNDHDFNTYIFGEPFEVKVANFFISKDDVFENLTDAIEAVEENGIIYANFNYHIEENMEIEITKSFTIKNYKSRMVIFDGNATQWFFTVAEGCNVVFEGINFTDGGIKDYASFENKGTLTFKDCIFSDFETEAIIYNTGTLNIINSEFSDNTLYSAIVLNGGKLSIDSSVFTGNVINTNSVILNNGIADITSSTFTENINFGNGGAIYNTKSLNITDTVFRENEGIDGGAVYNSGTMHVKNSTFEDNAANGYGGAIYNEGELNVFDSTFTGGFSERDGGAIYNNNVANVDNSTFIANTATGNGGAIYNNKKLVLTDSFFGINYGEEFANIYNAGNIEFTGNTFDFYDVILYVPYGQYDIPTVITGTLDPQFNMDVQLILPGFVNNTDALAYLQEGIFEYDTGILPKGIYPVKLDEIIYDTNGNVYYGEAVTDRLIITKANVTLNITVDDIVLKNASQATPVLKINASKDGIVNILFNNKLIIVNITGNYAEITLDSVEEGNYSVMVFRAGDENYNDAVNTTTFQISEYECNFLVESTGHKFDTLREAIADASDDDLIYVNEGNYTGDGNLNLTVSGKKLTITPLGVVVFYANSTDSYFLTIDETSDVTLEDIVITGFNSDDSVIDNHGNLTVDGCTFANNNLCEKLIDSCGNLTVVGSEFYDNVLSTYLIYVVSSSGDVLINESTFENNTVNDVGNLISIYFASAKIISNEFVDNRASGNIITVIMCSDVLIESVFINNTQGSNVISADRNSNLLVENSIFTGNDLANIIFSTENNQIISNCTFTDNAVENVVYSEDNNLSVFESTFSANTLSGDGALYLASNVSAAVDDCLFTGNKADDYRNIYSVSTDVKITNTVFDAINVDYSVYDIDYAENETIEGTIDIGTNLNFTVNLKINSKTYSVNVTDSKFTYNLIRPSGGDYTVILDSADSNSNSFVFNQITRTFTVNRVDPNLKVIIPDINQGEKLNVTLFGNRTNHVVFELNGNSYTNETLQDLTLAPGDYLIIATFAGDRNYLPATVFVNVKVHKVTPNITVNDVVVDYGDDVKIDAAADAADYYTAIIGNETLTLYVRDKVTFTFPALDLKPGIYEIIVYVFENNEHAEAYANATLTVNKADGVFRLNNDIIIDGENATVSVNVPLHADGNITYNVFSEDLELVYNITQSCLEELVVPGLTTGNYMVTGTYSGDSYYTAMSKVTSGTIYVNTPNVDLTVTASEVTYGEPAVITVNSKIDGEYLVWVDGENFTVNVIDGTGNVSVPNLNAGNHTANATIIHEYYVAYNEAVFEVAPKPVWVVVIVEDIVQGEDAIVHVYGEIDGKYIVEVNNQTYTVNVTDGEGNTTVSDLNVVGDMMASVSIDENNYAASDNTTFNVASKEVTAIVSVGNIIYGDEAVVIVQSNVSGDYIVTIRDVNYTVHVNGGNGVIFVQNLTVGNQIPVTVKRDDRHTAFNKTAFDITPKMVNVALSVEDITWNEKAIINITAEIDGMYTLTVNNVEYPIKVTGGKASQVITDLAAKNYDAQIVIVNGNYSASNQTEFNVAPKPVNLIISVEGITYGDEAKVIVKSDADGEYLVYVDGTQYSVNVTGGVGDVPVGGLTVGDHAANVTVVDGNYSGSNSTTFAVAVKPVNVAVAVDGITYGDDANVTVKSDVDGEYLVYVDGIAYAVTVSDGVGDVPVGGLTVGDHVANVTVVDGNYSGSNSTTFAVAVKPVNVAVAVDGITYGDDANVTVKSDVDGEYLVYVDGTAYTVVVSDGVGNIPVGGLTVGDHVANVTVVDGNYSGSNSTTFAVAVKPVNVTVIVEDIVYGNKANVTVKSAVDGEYLVYVDGTAYTVVVSDGVGNVPVGGLTVGDHVANVTVVDGNYSGSNSTTFAVAVKPVNVAVTVKDIVYGNKANVTVKSEVDGGYLVYVDDTQYTVVVTGGVGNVPVGGLTVGIHVANVTVVDGNYSGSDSTTFAVAIKQVNVTVTVEDIVYGNKANVTVKSDVDGGYLVYIDDAPYSVIVSDGVGNVPVGGLTVGSHVANVTVVDKKYLGSNSTTFAVAVKQVDVSVVVDGITYGDDAKVIVKSDVDGEYLVYVDGTDYTVTVSGGVGYVPVGGLTVGDYVANVTVVDGNYSGSNSTTFAVAIKQVNVSVSVDGITYGDDAKVIVKSDVDGEYLVYVDDAPYTVTVTGGVGNVTADGLTAGDHVANVTVVDGNCSGSDSTAFVVAIKQVDVSVSVDGITYGDKAEVIVKSDVDGEYLVYVDDAPYTVTVTGGVGNVTADGLTAGDHVANVTVVDGNYSGSDSTAFVVAIKQVDVSVSVDGITYGDKAEVIVKSDVDGEYLVYVDDAPYTVTVSGGVGYVPVGGLTAGDHVANVTVVDGNYSGSDSTAFVVAIKQVDVSVAVDGITYGDDAKVIVKSDVDGEYLVYVDDAPYTVTVTGGVGNVTAGGLTAGDHVANVTVVDGNYSGSDSTAFAVAVKQVNVSVAVEGITYGDKAEVIVKSDVDGEYLVYVDDTPYTVVVSDGIGNVTADGLTAGGHVANVTVVDGNYSGSDSTAFAVAVKQVSVTVSVEDVAYGNKANVTVKSDVDGEYLVYVDDTPYTVIVTEGVGNVAAGGLTVGGHAVSVTVVDGNYSGSNSTTFNVSKAKTEVDIEFEKETTGTPLLEFRLPSDAGGNVSVYVNEKLSQVVKLTNGSANIIVTDLNIGSNNVTVVYSGDDNYDSLNKSFAINRTATIEAYDMTRGYNSGLDYTAKLYDASGSPLPNANVTIKVGTNTYTVQTDSNGVFAFNNKLAVGDYAVAIVNPETGEYKLTNLKIVKRITANKDVKIFFADNSKYKVRVVGDDGSYVGAGEVVSINVGGKTYSVKTDKNGYATLKLSLKVKKHTITVTYKGFTTKNKVTVKSVVKPVKKTVKVKKTAKKLKIKVKLKGKKVLKKKRVYLKFKGKTYKAKTNKKGIATFKVPKKVIKKLKKGKKYTAKFTYKAKANGKTIKDTAKCKVNVK